MIYESGTQNAFNQWGIEYTQCVASLTDRVLWHLGEAAPDLGLIHLVRIIETSLNADNVLCQNAHGKGVFVILLEYCECLFIKDFLEHLN